MPPAPRSTVASSSPPTSHPAARVDSVPRAAGLPPARAPPRGHVTKPRGKSLMNPSLNRASARRRQHGRRPVEHRGPHPPTISNHCCQRTAALQPPNLPSEPAGTATTCSSCSETWKQPAGFAELDSVAARDGTRSQTRTASASASQSSRPVGEPKPDTPRIDTGIPGWSCAGGRTHTIAWSAT